jgi:phage shock protein E
MEKLIIVYCTVGGRANITENKLIELGYKNVINFGGINSWNYELEKRN